MNEKASDVQVDGRHYKDMAIQPAEFCQKNQLNFCESAVVKYVCRHKSKGGVKDIDKAIHFLQLLKEWEYPAEVERGPIAPKEDTIVYSSQPFQPVMDSKSISAKKMLDSLPMGKPVFFTSTPSGTNFFMNEYQLLAAKTALYPGRLGLQKITPESSTTNEGILYCGLGLAGEAGEVVDKIKKILRDKKGIFDLEAKSAIAMELGDELWYVAMMAEEIGYTMQEIAEMNLDKLDSRQKRNVLGGSGDNR